MPSGQLRSIEFVAKWQRVELSDRAASHEHFIDFCRMRDHPFTARCAETDQRVLANLLRLNLARAGRA